jgi:hypothetical protein
METVRGKIFGMKQSRNSFEFLVFSFKFLDSNLKTRSLKFIALFAVSFFAFLMLDRAQQIPVGQGTGFAQSQYFEPPNGQQVKMKMSGASVASLPGGMLDITDLKIETFDVSGKTEAIVRAPQCRYSIFDSVASSAGHLELQTGDGNMRTTGDGFLWRQSDNSLTISNNVHTVIQTKNLKLTMP